MPQSAGPTTIALAIAALLAVLPFVAIAVVNIDGGVPAAYPR